MDMTLCEGTNCPMAQKCVRFKNARYASNYQSWFVTPPVDGNTCTEFIWETNDGWHNLLDNPDDLPIPVEMPENYTDSCWKLVRTASGFHVACYRTIGRVNSSKPAWWVKPSHGDMRLLNTKVIMWKNID